MVVYWIHMVQYSVYLHIPFCRHRCGYCDFNTYAGLESLIGEYTRALCREIELLRCSTEERLPVHTIFFGGGTPSLLPLQEVERILSTLEASFDLQPGVEISLEANPGTLTDEYLRGLRSLGVNRLSLGMQSANPEELRLLERQHSYHEVAAAVAGARKAGFDNLNLDLIYGLPHQRMETWQHTMELALGLHPEHISLYALTLEHGTPLNHWVQRGLLAEPDPDLAADMYEWADERLARASYRQYEISNWAIPSGQGIRSCRHNLQYWRNQPYLGFGAGAHGYAAGMRTINVLAPAAYIERCIQGEPRRFPLTPATQTGQQIDRRAEIGETMMMGLRLTEEGVSRLAFEQRFGTPLEAMFGSEIEELSQKGLLEVTPDRIRLTTRGRLLGNQVFMRFL